MEADHPRRPELSSQDLPMVQIVLTFHGRGGEWASFRIGPDFVG